MKNSISLVIIVLLVILAVAGYFWYKTQQKGYSPPLAEPFGTLPDIKPVTNPLADKPDLNPVGKTNPFKGFSKNPFE